MDSGISMLEPGTLWDVLCCTFSMRWGKKSGTLWHVPQCILWYMKGIPKSHGTAVGNAGQPSPVTQNTYILPTWDVSSLNSWYKCFVSLVVKQMTSNTVVAKRDTSCKCVLLASQFKSSLAAVAGSVALFTHCQVVQLSAITNFVILNRGMQVRTKNCKFYWPERG